MKHPHPAIRDAYAKLKSLSDRVGTDLLECDRCGHEMVVRATQVSEEPCRNDIRIKCPTTDAQVVPPESDPGDYGITLDGCGWWTRHGIPITRGEYEQEIERRNHPFVDAVTSSVPPDIEAPETTVQERLRALGYLDE